MAIQNQTAVDRFFNIIYYSRKLLSWSTKLRAVQWSYVHQLLSSENKFYLIGRGKRFVFRLHGVATQRTSDW